MSIGRDRAAVKDRAGSSELVVVADSAAEPQLVAADLLIQAEHDPEALPVLVTISAELADAVKAALAEQLLTLPTRDSPGGPGQRSAHPGEGAVKYGIPISEGPMTMIPRTLAKRLRDGQVIPFVGAGVSMAVRRSDGTALFPSWRELLLRGADRLAEEGKPTDAELVRALLAVDDADYLAAAKRLRDKLGAVWIPFLKDQLDPSRNHVDTGSLALARAVWALGSKLILTTNYDRVLAWACPDPLRDDLAVWDVEAVAEQAQLLRDGAAQKATVWHLHGRIDNAARLVLTPDGYRRLYPLGGEHESQHRAALTASGSCSRRDRCCSSASASTTPASASSCGAWATSSRAVPVLTTRWCTSVTRNGCERRTCRSSS